MKGNCITVVPSALQNDRLEIIKTAGFALLLGTLRSLPNGNPMSPTVCETQLIRQCERIYTVNTEE